MQMFKQWLPGHDLVLRFVSDERGTTAIEYGLIAALVACGMLVGLKALGQGNASSWGNTANNIANAMK
jgi:pilus assembly protein Flp/PilA